MLMMLLPSVNFPGAQEERHVFRSAYVFQPGYHMTPYTQPTSHTVNIMQIYREPMVSWLNSNASYAMILAESIDYDEETLTITIHLRQGVLWHDGTLFTSEDVATTLGVMWMWNYIPPEDRTSTPLWKEVSYPDDYTVVIELDRPTLEGPVQWGIGFQISCSRTGPLAKFGNATVRNWIKENNTDAVEALKAEYTDFRLSYAETIGTGPFYLSIATEEAMVFEKFEGHRNANKVAWDAIELLHVPSAEVRNFMMLRGEIHAGGVSGTGDEPYICTA
jgi:ABC-type transport system substrate-binding protein